MVKRGRRVVWVLGGLAALFLAWLAIAYLVLPFLYRHDRHLRGIANVPMLTHTADGLAADPINVGLIGTERDLAELMHAIGWFPADPVTLKTSVGIVGSVLLDRPYADAPISPLFLLGRRQDLAFEQAIGNSADRRRHVRFWWIDLTAADGRPVWLAAATLDIGVELSRTTGQVTHRIAPDIDTTRDALTSGWAATGRIAETFQEQGVGPTLWGRNGGGDRYWTDGEVRFSVVAAPGRPGKNPPPELPNPPLVDVKDAIWPQLPGAATAHQP